ncbi:MAG: thioredoxin family protein [Candidatus Acetothermia bacterium]|jgi:glutaredoxin|nr:thioredoxin family protein [Candidatus Acetothermia bacterium]
MMKRAPVFAILLGVAVVGFAAQVELHFFWATGCPHCEIMREFLDSLVQGYPDLRVVDHEVAFHPEEWRLMVNLAAAYDIEATETPVVFVGDLATVGIGRAVELLIQEEVERCLVAQCPSPLARLPDKVGWQLSPLEASLLALAVAAALFIVFQLTSR